jgi:putative transposase
MRNPIHHPPHLLIDNSWYFITAHTFDNIFAFSSYKAKENWISAFANCCKELNIKNQAFVIMSNHYHILCYFENAQIIPRFINLLHGRTSYFINSFENQQGRRIWHNYWDRLIRNEKDFWTKFNYIHYNPVKHGCVSDPVFWRHSSYEHFILTKGSEWMADCFETYPIIDCDFEYQ